MIYFNSNWVENLTCRASQIHYRCLWYCQLQQLAVVEENLRFSYFRPCLHVTFFLKKGPLLFSIVSMNKGSFTRTVSVNLFIIVWMKTGRLLVEWVPYPFCKKTAHFHWHNDKQLDGDGDGTCKRALTHRMGPSPILSIIQPVTIDTILDNNGPFFKNVACKQGFKITNVGPKTD